MRILNVNVILDAVSGGGTAERTFQVSRCLAAAGAECAILTTDIGLTPQRLNRLPGVAVAALPCLFRRYYVPRFSSRQIEDLVAWADVIHLNSHWTVVNALVYAAARRLQKPYTVCPAGALPIYGRSRLLKQLYNRVVGRRIVRHATSHIAIPHAEKNHFRDYGVDAGNVSVIPNGINPDDYSAADDQAFRGKFGLPERPFVLYLGRFNPIKGPDLLLRAFCQLKDEFPDHDLVLAGTDEGLLEPLRQMAAAGQVENRVHFIGYIEGADKSHAYHAAALSVVPSRQDAMSIVALEAGAAGTPVLLTDSCGFDEIDAIEGGRVVPASVEGLRQGLAGLLQDPADLQRMGHRLRQFVVDNYTWAATADKYFVLSRQIQGRN
jgi:glycosyltransferase involved in cell wall biosynthesis